VASFLATRCDVDEKTARWAASLGQGAIGRGMGFLPDGERPGPLESLRRQAFALLEAALSDGRGAAFAAALERGSSGARKLIDLFAFLEDWLRDLAAVAAGAEDRLISEDARTRLQETVARLSLPPAAVTSAYPAVEEARELARGNVNPQLIVTRLLTRIRRSLRASAASTT
jgi:hypothetical protein